MNVEVFVICDAATESGGKLNLMGIFDTIFTEKVPAMHLFCSIAARIRFTKSDEGEHKVSIEIEDDKGEAIIPKFEETLPVIVEENETPTSNIIVNVQGLRVNNYGIKTAKLTLDDNAIASFPIFVKPKIKKDPMEA